MAKDWHREDIKAAIRKTGTSLQDLALANKLSRKAVSVTLLQPWPRVEAIVAKRLGLQPQEIWPSRYGPDGRPLRGVSTRQRHRTPAPTPCKRQKGVVR